MTQKLEPEDYISAAQKKKSPVEPTEDLPASRRKPWAGVPPRPKRPRGESLHAEPYATPTSPRGRLREQLWTRPSDHHGAGVFPAGAELRRLCGRLLVTSAATVAPAAPARATRPFPHREAADPVNRRSLGVRAPLPFPTYLQRLRGQGDLSSPHNRF